MGYRVELDDEVNQQLDALPASARAQFASLVELLSIAPWSGEPYDRRQPKGIQAHTFGPAGAGLALYLVLDHDERVAVLRVLWIG